MPFTSSVIRKACLLDNSSLKTQVLPTAAENKIKYSKQNCSQNDEESSSSI